VSIGRLFVAGVVPGVLMAIALIAAAMTLPRARAMLVDRVPAPVLAGASGGSVPESSFDPDARVDGSSTFVGAIDLRHPGPVDAETLAHLEEGTRPPFLKAFLAAIPGLLVPVIILGGIYGGIFTPTESAVVASVYALLVGVAIYREIKVTELPRVFTIAAVQSAVVMLIVGAASVFAYVITREQIARKVADAILGITENKFLILLVVMLLLLVVGMFMDAVSALYLFVPLLAPVLLEVGVDVTTIGVLMVVNLAVGMITPPVGVNLFVAAGIARISLGETIQGLWRFLAAVLVVLVLVTYLPILSNWLPDLLGV
jgi:C4-dicarboxylate transporter DctM subunit